MGGANLTLKGIPESWSNFAEKFGPEWLIILLIVVGLFSFVVWITGLLIRHKQGEIDRLAADNRRYREVYLKDIRGMSDEDYDEVTPPDDGLKTMREMKTKK